MKKQSLTQNNPRLTADIEATQKQVANEERQGGFNTYWHQKLARLLAAAEQLQKTEPIATEDKQDGSPTK